MCRPPTKFTSFPFREREQFLSDGRLNRRERRGDIVKAFALGVDAEEPSHETPKNIPPDRRIQPQKSGMRSVLLPTKSAKSNGPIEPTTWETAKK